MTWENGGSNPASYPIYYLPIVSLSPLLWTGLKPVINENSEVVHIDRTITIVICHVDGIAGCLDPLPVVRHYRKVHQVYQALLIKIAAGVA